MNGESFNFGPNDTSNKTVEELIKGLSERWGFDNQNDSFAVKHTKDFHEAGLLQLDCKKANEMLEWFPNLSFNEMINFSCDWYKEFYSNDEIETILLRTENQIEDYVKIARNKNYPWTN